MSTLKHVVFRRNEVLDMAYISLVLGVLFTFTFFRFEYPPYSFLSVFLVFFCFILFLLFSRMIFMKLFGVANGFYIFMRQTALDRYGLRKYDRLSNVSYRLEKKTVNPTAKIGKLFGIKTNYKSQDYRFDGIPSSILSIIIYIFTLGVIIFPSLWRYQVEKIPHLFPGVLHNREIAMNWVLPIEVTGYRISRVLFMGSLFYVLFAFFMKFLFLSEDNVFYWWFFFILFWIAIFNLLPIPGTAGFDFYWYSKFAWISAITVVTLGIFAVLVFEDPAYTIVVGGISFIAMVFVFLWRNLLK